MSDNEYNVAPVNHGALSTMGSVAVGTVGGAAKSFGKTMLWSVGLCALAGAAIGITLATAGAGASFVGPMFAGLVGGVGGAATGLFSGSFLGAFTGLFGAGKGALDAHERVSMEKGAARSMEMQLAAYQSMAASNDNKYNLPAQGDRMNPAMAKIDGSTIDRSGTIAAQQLQRA